MELGGGGDSTVESQFQVIYKENWYKGNLRLYLFCFFMILCGGLVEQLGISVDELIHYVAFVKQSHAMA